MLGEGMSIKHSLQLHTVEPLITDPLRSGQPPKSGQAPRTERYYRRTNALETSEKRTPPSSRQRTLTALPSIWHPYIFCLLQRTANPHLHQSARARMHVCLRGRTMASQVIAFGVAAEAQLEVLEIRSHIRGYHAYRQDSQLKSCRQATLHDYFIRVDHLTMY